MPGNRPSDSASAESAETFRRPPVARCFAPGRPNPGDRPNVTRCILQLSDSATLTVDLHPSRFASDRPVTSCAKKRSQVVFPVESITCMVLLAWRLLTWNWRRNHVIITETHSGLAD
jgi:hypothetical protein